MRVRKAVKVGSKGSGRGKAKYPERAPVVAALQALGPGYARVVAVLLSEEHEANPCGLYGRHYWWRRAIQVHRKLLLADGPKSKIPPRKPFPIVEQGREVDLPGVRDLDNRDCVHFEACQTVAARADLKSVCNGKLRDVPGQGCSQYLSRVGDWKEQWTRMMVNSDALGLGGYDSEDWERSGA